VCLARAEREREGESGARGRWPLTLLLLLIAGNILKDDILRFLNARQSAPAAPAAAAVAAAVPPAPPAAARAPQPIASSSAADRVEKVEGVRKIMAATMTRSHQIPALLFCDEVEVDALVALRKQLQPLAKEKGACARESEGHGGDASADSCSRASQG
jgi:pyruvate/2-oxoglutarate dehydrogenase complex dihydrolipoamide acyltransferase (E2) component